MKSKWFEADPIGVMLGWMFVLIAGGIAWMGYFIGRELWILAYFTAFFGWGLLAMMCFGLAEERGKTADLEKRIKRWEKKWETTKRLRRN